MLLFKHEGTENFIDVFHLPRAYRDFYVMIISTYMIILLDDFCFINCLAAISSREVGQVSPSPTVPEEEK